MSAAPLSRKYSIGTKIFAAFVGMGLITGALGAYGLHVLTAAGKIVAGKVVAGKIAAGKIIAAKANTTRVFV